MAIGTFNINDYLEKLHEEAEAKEATGIAGGDAKNGLIIPPENKKAYDWIKKEYDKAKVEVKVEMKIGTSKFEPSFTTDGAKNDFKPGMFGEIKTSDTPGSKKKESDTEDLTTEKDNKNPKESGEKENNFKNIKKEKSSNISAKVKTKDESDEDNDKDKDKDKK